MNNNVHPKGFNGLLSWYLQGEISDPHWSRITDLLDSEQLFSDERRAFACYVSDAVADRYELRPPTIAEANALFDSVRVYPYRIAAN